MAELRDAIKECVERLARHRHGPKRIGEQNTKASLIEPIIAALGWDVHDPDEVNREYRRHSRDNPVDYALLINGTVRLFIEAKGLGENLDDPRWARQTISYATDAGVVWVALTDGAEWRIYNSHAPIPVEQKLFGAARLADDIEGAAEFLGLLSKESVRRSRIDSVWQAAIVDHQVQEKLIGLFGDLSPAPEIVSLLEQRLPGVSREEIHSSLARVEASFTFPNVARAADRPKAVRAAQPPDVLLVGEQSRQPVAPTRREIPAKNRISMEERQTSILDLIAAGRLRPGAALHGVYMGRQYDAELLGDGTVRFQGEVHRSLSAAGKAVKEALHGATAPFSLTSTDGLEFWRAMDLVRGDTVAIKEIRRRVAEEARGSTPAM